MQNAIRPGHRSVELDWKRFGRGTSLPTTTGCETGHLRPHGDPRSVSSDPEERNRLAMQALTNASTSYSFSFRCSRKLSKRTIGRWDRNAPSVDTVAMAVVRLLCHVSILDATRDQPKEPFNSRAIICSMATSSRSHCVMRCSHSE
jgi:hypothetical protein